MKQTIYRVHRVDGSTEVLKDGELATLQAAVGGYIERTYSLTGSVLYVNEDGFSLGLPTNELASLWTGRRTVGDVVILLPGQPV
jgi:hypothetical protein